MSRYRRAEREARYHHWRRKGKMPVVTEGDSWFDYPMYRNLIDIVDDEKRFALKRLEFSGDTVVNMVGRDGQWRGLGALKTIVEVERPRFILFSGGGNDIVGEELEGCICNYDPTNDPAWHLDTPKWRELKANLEAAYRKLVSDLGPMAPIVGHGYDYVIPMNSPVKYDGVKITGPWVWPEMERCCIPPEAMQGICNVMLDWFNELLKGLAAEHRDTGYFGYIDLRGTLASQEWENEIHPTKKGFAKVGESYLQQLYLLLPSLLAAHDRNAVLRDGEGEGA